MVWENRGLILVRHIMRLYLKNNRSLEDTASAIAAVALPDHKCQLRDGLNLGGGEYFKFFTSESEILLVCNDQEHMEVFVKEKASFPFYCYVWKGSDAILEAMLSSLQGAGFACELFDENA